MWAVGDDLVLRVVKDPDPPVKRATVERDVALLAFAGTALHAAAAAGGRGGPRGRRAADDPDPGGGRGRGRAPGPTALADDLATFLSALHGVAPALAAEVVRPDPDPAEAWLEQVGEEYAEVAADVDADLHATGRGVPGRRPTAARPGPGVLPQRRPGRPRDGRPGHRTCHRDHRLGRRGARGPGARPGHRLTDFGPAVLERVLAGYRHPREMGLTDRIPWVARRRMVEDRAWRVRTGDAAGLGRTSSDAARAAG